MIEFVVAIALFVTVLVPVAKLINSSIVVSGNSRSRVAAAYLAGQTVEQVRSSASKDTWWSTLSLGVTVSTSTAYTITRNLEWVGQGVAASQCSTASGASAAQLLQVTASVTWTGMGGIAPVISTADLAPPAGAFSLNTGAVSVLVVDANGQPNPGRTIVLTDGSYTSSITTGVDGCAFFSFVPPGLAYTASSTGAGLVSDQEAATSTSNQFQVSPGYTVQVPPLALDVAGTLLVTPWTAWAQAQTLLYSVHQSSLTPQPSKSFTSGVTTLTPLFPFPGGYVPFAGNCTDSDPLGKNTSLAPFYTTGLSPQATTPVGVSPVGSTTPVTTVVLYPLSLLITSNPSLRTITSITATPTTSTAPTKPVWSASSFNWVCPITPLPVFTLAPFVALASTSGIGLGHYTVQVTTSGPKTVTLYVWVEPDGTHVMTNTSTPVVSGQATAAVAIPA